MDAQTYPLLSALGSTESLQIIVELLEEPGTVEEVSRRTGVASATVSRRLDALAATGVVSRNSARAAYYLSEEELTRRVVEALSELSAAILQSRLAAEKSLQRRVRRSRLSPAKPSNEAPA